MILLLYALIFQEKTIMSLPIPAKGPKVTSLIWNGVDDLIVTGHDNGDIVQVCNNCWYKLHIPFHCTANFYCIFELVDMASNKEHFMYVIITVGCQDTSKSQDIERASKGHFRSATVIRP